MASEEHIWSGTPSQIVNLPTFILCGFLSLTGVLAIVAIPFALWRWLVVKNTHYELTSQRLKTHLGVLSKRTNEIELYRVKDSRFDQSLFLRMFGLGSVVLISSDSTTPVATINSIPDARALRERIRTLVEERRDQKRVRVTEIE
jgi:membrane protein YdbS with pleckstrin-like domain